MATGGGCPDNQRSIKHKVYLRVYAETLIDGVVGRDVWDDDGKRR